jgi:diguanylate cyclase (GGDEF)-like protein
MKKVLVIEDSKSLGFFHIGMIRQKLQYPVHLVKSKKELEIVLKSNADDFFAAIVDMILPDAPNGEALEVVLSYNIPAIVYTGSDTVELREQMKKFPIVDYVTKNDPGNFNYILRLLKFINHYGSSKILIVDDSMTARAQIVHTLKGFGFTILEASSGEEALVVLEDHNDIILITMDKEMPGMNGYETIKNIRRGYDYSAVNIFGISSSNDEYESIHFIKNGANDFIYKPFLPEELLLRVMSNIELISMIHEANERAIRDFMTRLYNRKYVFENGLLDYKNARKHGKDVAFAMVDIDHFKRINDTYGHAVGDSAIILLASLLHDMEKEHAHFAARVGGEEFLLMWVSRTKEEIENDLETLQLKLKDQYVLAENEDKITYTVSIGWVFAKCTELDGDLAHADEALYKAKETGRDKICYL